MLVVPTLALTLLIIADLCLFTEAVVYVVPVFEIQLGKPIPESKKDLGEAVQSGKARQFYMTRCFKCHSPTDYNRWLK